MQDIFLHSCFFFPLLWEVQKWNLKRPAKNITDNEEIALLTVRWLMCQWNDLTWKIWHLDLYPSFAAAFSNFFIAASFSCRLVCTKKRAHQEELRIFAFTWKANSLSILLFIISEQNKQRKKWYRNHIFIRSENVDTWQLSGSEHCFQIIIQSQTWCCG